jgi:hypothetical protein
MVQGLATGNFKIDVRGLGTTIAAAALIGAGPNLDAKATFMDNLASQVVHELKAAPTRMAINTTIGGERFEDAAISTLRQGASHAIGATLAHQLGQLYKDGPDKLGYFTHKLAHFASGALTGTIMANDPFGGAFSAAFAEVAMEAMVDAKAEVTAIKQENPGLKEDELREKLHNRLMAKRFFSQVIGGFVGTIAGKGNFSLAASTAAIALDYNMMPTLLDEACREYYGLTTEALDAREIERPLTPRTLAAIEAFNEYNEMYEHLDEIQREQHKIQEISAESYAANAYQGTERMLAENAAAKFATGQEITEYEREVISDFVDLGIDKTKSGVATVAITMAVNVALKSVATRVPFAARLIAGKTLPVKVSQAVTTAKSAALGKAIRPEAIPVGSRLEYLAPGRVRFDGVEFRAVRDLGHLSQNDLKRMLRDGVNPRDIKGTRLDGHHFGQKYHREPGAFIVEIPDPAHCISNPIQHPLGVNGGLSGAERANWNILRKAMNKERARTELLRRNGEH